ncbi:MAG: formylglycine-generating enzyme family protein, partial [Nitrososphaera sp.]|nr:formylglycine-generating enzyme family protein [Nitrososphaera sp.]
EAVMGKNPSHFKGDPALPVENVTWNDAKEFCEKLTKMTGLDYRLPTEAEWEYACRAGTTGDYGGDLDVMAWYSKNSGVKTHPVGQKNPNAWGLHDMHGNVWEWCEDDWNDSYASAPTDGRAWVDMPSRGSFRVLRGGSWCSHDVYCRSAFRILDAPGHRLAGVGFRLVVG